MIMSHLIGRGRGQLHELPDQLATLLSFTGWVERIDHATEARKDRLALCGPLCTVHRVSRVLCHAVPAVVMYPAITHRVYLASAKSCSNSASWTGASIIAS